MKLNKIYQGDCLEVLKEIPDESVDMVMTSPPYWALRDYGVEGQLGLEPTFQEYINKLCDIFDEVKRILKKEGTCWVNMGDTYFGKPKSSESGGLQNKNYGNKRSEHGYDKRGEIYKNTDFTDKCLCQIPSRFAIEMTNRGWILRNEIIWHKPNCMPSSVKDRFTVDFEKLFMFCKSKEKSNDIKEWLPNKLKPEDASWLAAIVDGEGTIGIRRSKRPEQMDSFNAYLTVANSYKPLVEKCLAITGIGTIREDVCKTNFTMYRWEVSHNKAVSVIGEIYPYLIQKREQAKIAIEIQKLAIGYGGQNKGRRIPQETYNRKGELWALCKELNQRTKDSSGLAEPNLNRYSGCEDYYFETQYEEATSISGKPSKPSAEMTKAYLGNPPTFTRKVGEQGRNKRCVWRITTKPYKEAHFATYPEALCETPIKAGCPEFVCKKCGKAREKIYESDWRTKREGTWKEAENMGKEMQRTNTHRQAMAGGLLQIKEPSKIEFKGYTDCGCNAGWEGGIVLDPFMGAGTTGVVAQRLGRNWIGIELNEEYIKLANKRINAVIVPLL